MLLQREIRLQSVPQMTSKATKARGLLSHPDFCGSRLSHAMYCFGELVQNCFVVGVPVLTVWSSDAIFTQERELVTIKMYVL